MNQVEGLTFKGIIECVIRDARTGKIKRVHYYENLVTQVALNMIADRLAGGSNNCDITYGAVGTNATVPVIGNTTLGTESARKAVSTIASSTSQVNVVTFFGASEANATLTEFGLFGEAASGTVDTGTMFNHAVISETKTSSETLTITSTITIS